MNSGFTEIHRFAMLTRRKQRSKRAWKGENVQPQLPLPRPLGEVAQSKTVTERADAHSTSR